MRSPKITIKSVTMDLSLEEAILIDSMRKNQTGVTITPQDIIIAAMGSFLKDCHYWQARSIDEYAKKLPNEDIQTSVRIAKSYHKKWEAIMNACEMISGQTLGHYTDKCVYPPDTEEAAK